MQKVHSSSPKVQSLSGKLNIMSIYPVGMVLAIVCTLWLKFHFTNATFYVSVLLHIIHPVVGTLVAIIHELDIIEC